MPELPRSRRFFWITLISIAVFAVIWSIAPWLFLRDLRVEAFRVERPAALDRGQPANSRTSAQLRVSFSTTQDIDEYRSRWGLPFIQAGISSCGSGSHGSNDEVVAQDTGYFAEDGQVRALGRERGRSGRYTYEAVFDDELDSVDDDHRLRRIRALSVPGGLCFRLHGATLAAGSMRSANIRLNSEGPLM